MTVKHFTKKRKIAITAIVLGCLVGVTGIVTTSVLLSGNRGALIDAPIVERPIDGKPNPPPIIPDPTLPKPTIQSMGMPILNSPTLELYNELELSYNATLNQWATHQGVDFSAPAGTPVVAILDGVVSAVSKDDLNGTFVTLSHSDKRTSTYKSLDKVTLVKVGDSVKKGVTIGTVSDTMATEAAQGAHLHFELRLDDKLVDPSAYIAELGGK